MTAVCLKAKNSVKTDAWSSVFTNFNTHAQSCMFIKQLTSTCISTILHLRKVLSEDYFEEKSFEGMTLKLLKSKKGDNYVSKIEKWLEGAYEAIEKQYLKRLMLDIQDAKSNMTLEIYTMKFNYNKEKNILNPTDSESLTSTTKLNTIKLLQMCYAITETYNTLPSQVKLSMRLSYYENTPENYQPNGYMAWSAGDPEFLKQPRGIEIGVTGTQHHFFKFLNKSCLNDNFFKGMEEKLENSNPTLQLETINNLQSTENLTEERQTKAKRELCFTNSNKNIEADEGVSPRINKEISLQLIKDQSLTFTHQNHRDKPEAMQKKKIDIAATKNVRVPNKLPIKGDLKVRCACLCPEISETMFPCLGCRFLVHGECFGILKFDSSKKIRFYCHLCHQTENNFKCHDKVIINLKNPSDQQKLSLLRRVLRYCTLPSVDKITLKKMEKIAGSRCAKNVVNVILNKMIEIGVAIPQGRRKNYLINKKELTDKLVHYFYKVQNSSQSQSKVVPYSLRTSENGKNKIDPDEFVLNKKSKPLTAAPQKFLAIQASQQSCDIFSS